MVLTYFDAKREIKKIYNLGLRAIKQKDLKYINFLLFNLKQLEDALNNDFQIDAFGTHVLKKDIEKMRLFLSKKI